MPLSPRLIPFALALTLAGPADLFAQQGVDVGRPSSLRRLVPADSLEQQSIQQYGQMLAAAREKNALAPDDHPQLIRLRQIAARITPFTGRFNQRASDWRWEVNLIGSKQINAFCMPGGKIAFYTGILDTLELTDDEVAAIMGHEMAHALREHARERIAKSQLTRLGTNILGSLLFEGRLAGAFDVGGSLLTLKFSRDDETEADLIGLELSARAGFDPRAGISVWQKMGQATRGGPPQWLSTHPSGKSRIADMQRVVPQVMPIYEQSRKTAISR
ncbi:MAG TPA: M48 family metallopeptidase [Rhodocyclaceae bacterium]